MRSGHAYPLAADMGDPTTASTCRGCRFPASDDGDDGVGRQPVSLAVASCIFKRCGIVPPGGPG